MIVHLACVQLVFGAWIFAMLSNAMHAMRADFKSLERTVIFLVFFRFFFCFIRRADGCVAGKQQQRIDHIKRQTRRKCGSQNLIEFLVCDPVPLIYVYLRFCVFAIYVLVFDLRLGYAISHNKNFLYNVLFV